MGSETSFERLRATEIEAEMERHKASPKYRGLTFASVQQIVEVMIHQKLQKWEDLYANPAVVVTRNIDFRHLQRIGVPHYLWKYGWQNVDNIELDIRGDGRVAPNFEGRKPGFLRILRQADLDQIVDVHIDYVMPDLNERGFEEAMSVYLRRHREDEQGIHRLVLRAVSECSFFVEGVGLVYQLGGGVGLGPIEELSGSWNKPRYTQALKEVFDLLKVEEIH